MERKVMLGLAVIPALYLVMAHNKGRLAVPSDLRDGPNDDSGNRGPAKELENPREARKSGDNSDTARSRLDPAFAEFLDAMQRIKGRYAIQQERAEERSRELPPAGASPERDSRYGPDFAGLPLGTKLAIMQENAKGDMMKSMADHQKRMKEYEKELNKKSQRFDKALPDFPGSLVKSGEPPDLANAFGKDWLRLGDSSSDRAFYHSGLLSAFFTSELPADRVETFLREVYAEFKSLRARTVLPQKVPGP